MNAAIRPVALTVAGFDPTGGAGVLADCRTFGLHGVEGFAAITALTVQNGISVERVEAVELKLLERTIRNAFETAPIAAVKSGLIPNAATVRLLAQTLPREIPLVIDPVLAASGGFPFLDREGQDALRELLFPKATLLTPNLPEAEVLTGEKDPARAAAALRSMGAAAVLIKGGHSSGPEAIDLLFEERGVFEFRLPRFEGRSVHGTGCALSAAITAELARGETLRNAIKKAKDSLHKRMGASLRLGTSCPRLN